MGFPRTGIALCVSLSLALTSRSAAGQAPPRVALLVDRTDDPVGERLRAELLALGFGVEVVQGAQDAPTSRALLEETARRTDAVAALRVVSSQNGIEVWVVDRVTNKTVLREIVTGDDPSDPSVVTLRAVELLRASLMEIDAPHEVRGEVEVPANVRAIVPRPVEPRTEWIALDLGPGATFTPTAVEIRVGVRARLRSRLALDLRGYLPASTARIEETEGHADLSTWFVGLGVTLDLGEGPLAPRAGVGVGLFALRMIGVPRAGYAGQRDGVAAGVGYLHAGLVGRISESLRIFAEILGGLSVPELQIQFADRKVQSFGRPLVLAALGVEVGIP